MDDSYEFWTGLSRILGFLSWLWLFWFISEKIREKEQRDDLDGCIERVQAWLNEGRQE